MWKFLLCKKIFRGQQPISFASINYIEICICQPNLGLKSGVEDIIFKVAKVILCPMEVKRWLYCLEILKYEFGWWQRLKEKYWDEKEPYFETFSVYGSKGAKSWRYSKRIWDAQILPHDGRYAKDIDYINVYKHDGVWKCEIMVIW